MSSWNSSYYEVVKELDETQRKLRKAEHDRDRYKKRIKFLQGRHEVIIALHRAITKERDILQSTVRLLERRLFYGDESREAAGRTGTPE